MTAEIAARTQPNTLDLVVALFSGAVGALATSSTAPSDLAQQQLVVTVAVMRATAGEVVP